MDVRDFLNEPTNEKKVLCRREKATIPDYYVFFHSE